MKKLLFIPLILILAFSLVIGSCGEPEETTTAPPPTTTTTGPPPTTTTGPPPTTTAPPTTTEPTPTGPEGDLRIAIADFGNETWDPNNFETFFGWFIYDTIMTFGPDNEILPELAETYTVSPDGKTHTFTIRQDVTWHNGDPLTAHDVAWTINRFAGLGDTPSSNPWTGGLADDLDYVEATDDYTVVVHNKVSEGTLIVPLQWTRVLPKNYIEENGLEYFYENPIGTGPWKFVSLTPDTECVFEAVENHWKRTPAFKRLIYLEIPEESTRIAGIKRGEIDITGVTFDRAVELQDDGYALRQQSKPTVAVMAYCGTWLTDNAIKDIRVRQAMSYAINRQEIADELFLGFAQPGGRWFMDPESWGWGDDWEAADPYDTALAESLLADAGYPDAFADPVIKMWLPGGNQAWSEPLQQLMAGYWEAVGLQVELVPIGPVENMGLFFVRATSPEDTIVGTIEWFTFGPNVPANPYHSLNMYTSMGVHSTGNDPMADELFFEAIGQPSLDAAEPYWTVFQEYAYDMWVTSGIVMIWDQLVVGPAVDPEGWLEYHVSLQDASSSIQHAE